MRRLALLALLLLLPVSAGAFNCVLTEPPAVLDDLTGADDCDAGGITGPSTQGHSWTFPIQSGYHRACRTSNTWRGAASGEVPESYITTIFPVNQVAEFELSALPANNNYYYAWMRITSPATAGLDALWVSVNAGATAGDTFIGFTDNDSADFSTAGGDVGSPAVGDRLRGVAIGNIEYLCYRYASSGAWSLIATRDVSDGGAPEPAEATGPGMIGFEHGFASTGHIVGLRGGAYRAPQAAMLGVGGM